MSALISKVIGVWRGANGALAEVVYDNGGGHGGDWSAVDALEKPLKSIHVVCELDDRQRIVLPFDDIGGMLPNRTGILVVFEEHPQANQGSLYFPVPDNAAIFNADGTLRFRLKNPCGVSGSFRGLQKIHKADGSWQAGVRACPMDWPTCDNVYVVDGSTPDLSQQTPIWMRF